MDSGRCPHQKAETDRKTKKGEDQMKQKTKDLRFLRLAREVSTWSKDPSTKVGAVIVGDNGQVISQGYNGFPEALMIQRSDTTISKRSICLLFTLKRMRYTTLFTILVLWQGQQSMFTGCLAVLSVQRRLFNLALREWCLIPKLLRGGRRTAKTHSRSLKKAGFGGFI